MSRYNLVSKNPNHVVTVGFDNPLQTYFVQVEDITKDEEEAMLLWAGAFPEEITEIEDLKKIVSPYGEVSLYVEKQLLLDRSNRTQPTRLQRFAAQKLRELKEDA